MRRPMLTSLTAAPSLAPALKISVPVNRFGYHKNTNKNTVASSIALCTMPVPLIFFSIFSVGYVCSTVSKNSVKESNFWQLRVIGQTICD